MKLADIALEQGTDTQVAILAADTLRDDPDPVARPLADLLFSAVASGSEVLIHRAAEVGRAVLKRGRP